MAEGAEPFSHVFELRRAPRCGLFRIQNLVRPDNWEMSVEEITIAADGNYALYVPKSLMADLRVAAEREGVSMNGFILQAVSEKVEALRARGLLVGLSPAKQSAYLQAHAARAQPGSMADNLARIIHQVARPVFVVCG